jgi:ketosteroid isomerase-like protein
MTQLRDAHDRWLRIGPCAIAIPFGASPLHAGAPQATDTGIRTLTGTTHEDSAAVARVVHRFHEALEAGDSLAALDLLHEDAVILESGGTETRAEYRAHHLPGDIAFARAVDREAGPVRVTTRGDVAWATSVSVMRGTFREREVNSRSVELMVLERTPNGWRIVAIHWSSRPLRQPAG